MDKYNNSICLRRNGEKKEVALAKNIELLPVMTTIVEWMVNHYKSDFYDYDVATLIKAATEKEKEDVTSFIWLIRDSGTWLLPERGIFMRDTSTFNHLHYYVDWEPNAVKVALEIRVKDIRDNAVHGDICSVDLSQYWRCVDELAMDTKDIVLQYESGQEIVSKGAAIPGPDPHPEYGKFLYYDYTVENEAELKRLTSLGWERLIKEIKKIA